MTEPGITETAHNAGVFTLGPGSQVITLTVYAPMGAPSRPVRFSLRNTATGETRLVTDVIPAGPYDARWDIPIHPPVDLGEYELKMIERVDINGFILGPLSDNDPTTGETDDWYGESEPLAQEMSDWLHAEVEKYADEEDSEVGFDIESSTQLDDFYIQGHVNLRALAAHLLNKGWSVPPAYAEGDWDDG